MEDYVGRQRLVLQVLGKHNIRLHEALICFEINLRCSHSIFLFRVIAQCFSPRLQRVRSRNCVMLQGLGHRFIFFLVCLRVIRFQMVCVWIWKESELSNLVPQSDRVEPAQEHEMAHLIEMSTTEFDGLFAVILNDRLLQFAGRTVEGSDGDFVVCRYA